MKGLEWCPDESITIGLPNLTRNILCEGHNSGLSDLDAAALQTFESFEQAFKLQEFRQQYPPKTKWSLQTFRVDGLLLERWFLKTLINITFGKQRIIGPGEREPGRPSLEHIQAVFGQRDFGENEGLHVSVHVGYQAQLRQGLSFTSLLDGDNIMAARFKFASLQFLLSLYPDGPLRFDGTSQLIRHLRTVNVKMTPERSHVSHRIRFAW